MLLWNACSLNNKFNDFQSYIYSVNYDIIAITETWLHDNIFSRENLPNNYTILRKDRDTRGGGVLLAFSDALNIRQLPCPNNLEVVTVEVDCAFTLCLTYRPPNAKDQCNSSLLSNLTLLDFAKNVAIVGDMNLPEVDWSTYSSCNAFSDDFTELAFDCNLTQLVTGPTRCAGNTLDIALTNFDGIGHVDTIIDLPPNLSSDHYMMVLTIDLTVPKHSNSSTTLRLDCNRANWESMNEFLYQYEYHPATLSSSGPLSKQLQQLRKSAYSKISSQTHTSTQVV